MRVEKNDTSWENKSKLPADLLVSGYFQSDAWQLVDCDLGWTVNDIKGWSNKSKALIICSLVTLPALCFLDEPTKFNCKVALEVDELGRWILSRNKYVQSLLQIRISCNCSGWYPAGLKTNHMFNVSVKRLSSDWIITSKTWFLLRVAWVASLTRTFKALNSFWSSSPQTCSSKAASAQNCSTFSLTSLSKMSNFSGTLSLIEKKNHQHWGRDHSSA